MKKTAKKRSRALITNLPLIKEVVMMEGDRDIYPLVVREVSRIWNGSGRMGSIEYQDMIGEVLLAVAQGAKRFTPGKVKFSTFIFRRIQGAAQDLMRKELSYGAHYDPTPSTTLIKEAGGRDGLELDVDARQKFLAVIRVLETRLDPKLSTILVRSFLEDRKDRDIASELKIPVPQVAELREKAIREVRKMMLLAGQPDHKQ